MAMSGKLKIIALAALGLVVFAAAFVLSTFVGDDGQAVVEPAGQAAQEGEDQGAGLQEALADGSVQPVTLRMKERELDELVKELRARIEACRKRQEELEVWDKRIRMAGEALKRQAQELEAIRMQLVAPLASMREAKAELENTRVRIGAEEAANVKRIAGMYEKMDSASGGQILADMCSNAQEDDAVKILHYMSERAAGKVLSEMPDKTLAARLCAKLKTIREEG